MCAGHLGISALSFTVSDDNAAMMRLDLAGCSASAVGGSMAYLSVDAPSLAGQAVGVPWKNDDQGLTDGCTTVSGLDCYAWNNGTGTGHFRWYVALMHAVRAAF